MKWFTFCLILLLTGACTLNSSQEATLHRAVTSYVDAHNNGAVMAYVGFTHPNVVGFYEEQGDSIFRRKFELFEQTNGGDFIQDGSVKEVEKRDGHIHVRYLFDSYAESNYSTKTDELAIIAISMNDGLSWFFVEEDDYKNDKIFSKVDRLIDL